MTHPILDHDLISQRYFFPRQADLPEAVWVPTPGGRLGCWRSSPPSDRPVLVHFHGNGEIIHDWMGDFVHWVQAQGYEVFLAEYRGYGASEGSPRLGAMLDDVSAIVEAIGVPVSQCVAFGRSIGSLYAAEMVARFPETRALVIESGIHNLLERLLLRASPAELGCTALEMEQAVQAHFDQRAKMTGFDGPSLFLHAVHDHLVGIQHAEANHRACQTGKSELVRCPSGDHNSILAANVQLYLQSLGHFLAEVKGDTDA